MDYKKGDTMHALGEEMKNMVEEQKKLIDKERKDDDSDHSDDSSEDGAASQWLFTSAIDVGSHFIDVNPSNQIEFNTIEGGHLSAQFTLHNPCKTAPTAFHVYTSSPIPIRIVPQSGFIPVSFQQVVRVIWEAQHQPDQERLENAMFFVKALPLSPDSQIDEMGQHLDKVFNTYNVNILFTTHHLPCIVKEQQFNPQQMQSMQQRQMQMQQQHAGGQQMTKEQWDRMTPEQQQGYRQQQAQMNAQREQQLMAQGQTGQPAQVQQLRASINDSVDHDPREDDSINKK